MTEKEEEALALFQCEENRKREESYVRGFVQNEEVELAFVNEGRAFTDGRNITVDPMMDMLFTDRKALKETSRFLGFRQTVRSPWHALTFTSRAQEVHEGLHILFSDFPPPAVHDVRSTTKERMEVLALIGNIIEDAFIESAGVSAFPNMELYLRWGRVSHLFAKQESAGTVYERLSQAGIDHEQEHSGVIRLERILEQMTSELLYPMVKAKEAPAELTEWLDQVRPLFFEGAEQETPSQRHWYACEIFDLLEPLIPEEMPDFSFTERLLGGTGTHCSSKNTFQINGSRGRACQITRRLFVDQDGNPIPFDEEGTILLTAIQAGGEAFGQFKQHSEPVMIDWIGSETGASAMHRSIRIREIHPSVDLLLEKSYRKIVSQYLLTINTYIRRFSALIQTENEVIEDRRYFGKGISSKHFLDIKKRCWYRTSHVPGTPELSVLLMIDGSGSMFGNRRNAAVQASVILHEVLKKNHIEHAVVEYRAIYDKPLVEHQVLLPFSAAEKEQYNLLRLSASDGTREGLSLFWAENYLAAHTVTDHQLIIVISDGFPEHCCEGSQYFPPVSVKDTANAAEKISRSGTKIIAVALGHDCYEQLCRVYPKTLECDSLDRLPQQLLKLIASELRMP